VIIQDQYHLSWAGFESMRTRVGLQTPTVRRRNDEKLNRSAI